mmetsp:Transcript_41570/g.98543  ORF Transcript_41570/g.98543 Transcript_41570/m.98543 type:complete len:222 (+) Transcript_41570:584-1249(+)
MVVASYVAGRYIKGSGDAVGCPPRAVAVSPFLALTLDPASLCLLASRQTHRLLGHPHAVPPWMQRSDPQKLDANNRGNMMARIQAGGTGGPPASAAAAAYLSGALHGDDDGPTVVLSGDLTFQDGWAAADASPGTRGALPPPGGAACEGAGSSPPLPPANAAAAPPGGPLAVCRGKERRKERRGKKKERSKETRKHERKRSRGGSDAREKPRRRSRKDAAP